MVSTSINWLYRSVEWLISQIIAVKERKMERGIYVVRLQTNRLYMQVGRSWFRFASTITMSNRLLPIVECKFSGKLLQLDSYATTTTITTTTMPNRCVCRARATGSMTPCRLEGTFVDHFYRFTM